MKIYIFTLILLFLALATQAYAQITVGGELAPLPGDYKPASVDFVDYIKALFPFMIFLTALASVGALIVGGFLYMTSGAIPSSLARAKSVMTDAIVGLIIALSTYLIINTVNPDILSLRKPGISTNAPSSE